MWAWFMPISLPCSRIREDLPTANVATTHVIWRSGLVVCKLLYHDFLSHFLFLSLFSLVFSPHQHILTKLHPLPWGFLLPRLRASSTTSVLSFLSFSLCFWVNFVVLHSFPFSLPFIYLHLLFFFFFFLFDCTSLLRHKDCFFVATVFSKVVGFIEVRGYIESLSPLVRAWESRVD